MPDLTFRELHQPGKPFILANAWDVGSARLMAALGAKAIASTSAGHAFTLGRPDMGHVTRDEAISHAKELVEATPLPVSGDLENGYGHAPDDVVRTINDAAAAGLAGCCIEDTRLPDEEPYAFANAVERVEAGVEAARSLGDDFVLTIRADGWMNRQYDFAEAMRRAKAFEAAGADVIYVPLLKDISMVEEVCREIRVPVNVLCAGRLTANTMQDFANAGVARISLGSMLSRVTHKAIMDASRGMFGDGSFALLQSAASGDEVDKLLEQGGKG
ncbi:MAG: isocitrate lyase/phosphoenolpyruvate mutase family protein [Pseudomonadota bacterium]